MNPRHFLRLATLARSRPSKARVITVFGAIALAVLIVAADRYGLAPDWMRAEPVRLRP